MAPNHAFKMVSIKQGMQRRVHLPHDSYLVGHTHRCRSAIRFQNQNGFVAEASFEDVVSGREDIKLLLASDVLVIDNRIQMGEWLLTELHPVVDLTVPALESTIPFRQEGSDLGVVIAHGIDESCVVMLGSQL